MTDTEQKALALLNEARKGAYAKAIRAALDAHGLQIVEKNDD